LVKPEHVMAAYQKYGRMKDDETDVLLSERIAELLPMARVIGLGWDGRDFAVAMTAISIIDLAIEEATAGKTT
jgi:hypothetical protein